LHNYHYYSLFEVVVMVELKLLFLPAKMHSLLTAISRVQIILSQ
jgi:hypothetical protein